MRRSIHRPGFLIALMLLLGSISAALLGIKAQAAPENSPGQDNVVISEFRTRGPSSGFELEDDFVEIFNPTDGDIDISDWSIESITGSGLHKKQA